MTSDDAVRGIENWVNNFWSLGGLLNKGEPRKPANKGDANWNKQEVEASFRDPDEPKRKVGKKPSRKATKKRTAPLANKRVGRKR